jgi:hypothetical protein
LPKVWFQNRTASTTRCSSGLPVPFPFVSLPRTRCSSRPPRVPRRPRLFSTQLHQRYRGHDLCLASDAWRSRLQCIINLLAFDAWRSRLQHIIVWRLTPGVRASQIKNIVVCCRGCCAICAPCVCSKRHGFCLVCCFCGALRCYIRCHVVAVWFQKSSDACMFMSVSIFGRPDWPLCDIRKFGLIPLSMRPPCG